MPLFPLLTGWNFARRIVLPTPGEDLIVELLTAGDSERCRTFHARLKSVGLRRLLADNVHAQKEAENEPLPRLAHEAAVASFARDSALYRFETVVETTDAPGTKERLLSLSRPKRVDRVQRRNAYRVTVEMRTTYRNLMTIGRESTELLHGQIVNLSEGGVLLASAAPVEVGHRIVIRVPSGRDGTPMDVTASCIESRAVATPRGPSYLSRLRFEDQEEVHLTDGQRDAILRYIFEQQRLMLQTRRLLNGPSTKK